MRRAFTGAAVFDGLRLHHGVELVVEEGRVAALAPEQRAGIEAEADRVVLDGGVLAPGLIDLQVNGGGGRMIDGSADADLLAEVCAVHARLGATGILPTLITDTAEATARVIEAGIEAAARRVPGFLGLHLEGPHLDPRRKGAHDPALIRPMGPEDLALLQRAAARLPALLLTVAPEAVTPAQIRGLTAAGAVVSLGHSDCSWTVAEAAFAAGAGSATHLFNAMSPFGSREPGLVGAVLAGQAQAGLIADGVHVSVPAMRVALAARPQGLYLVSDAMAVAGTALREITLGGRRILRRDGRLTLEDGTLAGADLSLPQAIGMMVREVGIPPEAALRMATHDPAKLIGWSDRAGRLLPGRIADMVHLAPDWSLRQVWRAGMPLLA